MIRSSSYPPWRPEPTSDPTEDRRSYTTPGDVTGVAVWKWQRSPDDEALELVALLQTGTFRTQADLAAAAGYSTGKVSKLKYRAISLGLITDEEWKECLAGEVENEDF